MKYKNRKDTTNKCKQNKKEEIIIPDKSVFQVTDEVISNEPTFIIKENDLTLFDILKKGSPCKQKNKNVEVKDIMSLTKVTSKPCINIIAHVKKRVPRKCITVVET